MSDIKITKFGADFDASRRAEKNPVVIAALRDCFPAALQVHRAHQQNDQLGIDVWIEYPGARMYSVDLKLRKTDYAARRGAPLDIVLEISFGDGPGWATKPTKAQGYLFVCLDTGRAAAFAAEAVCLALEQNLADWSSRFKIIETATEAFDGGAPIISKAIIVPVDVLTEACEKVRAGMNGGDSGDA
jgi:hypothetical protein